jgi:hypothetical protein
MARRLQPELAQRQAFDVATFEQQRTERMKCVTGSPVEH